MLKIEKIINMSNFNNLTLEEKRKYGINYGAFTINLGALTGIYSIFGINFTILLSRIAFICSLFVLALFINGLVNLIKLEKKNNIFYSKKIFYLFFSIFILLSLIFIGLTFVTVKYEYIDVDNWALRTNMVPFFCIYFPLYVFYLIICHFSFARVFTSDLYKKKDLQSDGK